MLLNLQVKNLALIEQAEVAFGDGLNVLTGETGAGKSIILGSINLALGAKVPKDFVRDESKDAFVELLFYVEEESQLQALRELEVSVEDGQVILSRKITNGRSISRVNGETVPAATLKKIAEILIDIHGQHEHQSLLHKKKHLEILDEFGKDSLEELKGELKGLYRDYQIRQEALDAFAIDEEEKNKEIDFLKFQIEEIIDAGLKIGEEEDLEQSYKKLNHSKKIMEAIGSVQQLTGYESHESAGSLIGMAVKELQEVTEYDETLSDMNTMLLDIDALLNDFGREVSSYLNGMEFEGESFAEIEERLNLIRKLEGKYGNTIELVLENLAKKEERLSQLQHYEEELENKKQKLAETKKALKELSLEITKIRKMCAKELENEIRQSLEDLNFLQVAFEISFKELEDFTALGLDEIEFLISTNPGESVKPLGMIASGGELSRIMLAIKTVLAKKDHIDTLIFDEIDVGISGRTAQKVSEKLAWVSSSHQVICITHLAQIASMADKHFVIEKQVENAGTITKIRELENEQQVEEIARILGGTAITDTTRESALEMKRMASEYKKWN